MIAISCLQCGKRLKVQDELAGKKVRCPQCKQALAIPMPLLIPTPAAMSPSSSEDATVAPSPAILSCAEAAPPGGISQRTPARNRADDDIDAKSEATEALTTEGHLDVAGEIARGGMGAIMRAVDRDIHREVAVKFLLNHADARQRARFVEEAQITGQLEHPNIVPIHQLGVHEDGRCFFSMKMVKGRSLAEILKDERNDYTLGRLLNIVVSICNALAYAHSRQVIHRDLKPANIMVGDFGEVYVMDWGLAKVLGKDEPSVPIAPSTHIQRKKSAADTTQPGSPSDSKSGERVTTHRQIEGELTQAGAIMGTPSYMPPEQAGGKLDAIDGRSDIYSLGAILYEMMTLTSPVGRGGDLFAVVLRVIEGKIDPPAKRAPERAREGWIPPELSAIAMKALAKDQDDRYPSVTALQRDIELFLEGRSVSAKRDTAWEMFKKLVKRNKGASIGAAAALLVLLGSLIFILRAWQETSFAFAEAQREQAARRLQGKNSAPSFLEDARQSTLRKKFEHALTQTNVALDFDPDLTDAWLLKGQLLLGDKKFDEAQKSLTRYLEHQPDDANAKKLVELCRRPDVGEVVGLMEFSETLVRQKAFIIAEVMMAQASDRKDFNQRLFKLYQAHLDAVWPGSGAALSIDGNGKISLDLLPFGRVVTDLGPLQGMKLHSLNLHDCRKVPDLAPLQGMPLAKLAINRCTLVNDLSPLKNMPLTSLSLQDCFRVQDLSPLLGMPLTYLNLHACIDVSDLSPLEGMKLTTLVVENCKLVTSLLPLQRMPLTSLNVAGCPKVSDLAPLEGMKLSSLNIARSQVKDLTPLQGMPLKSLDLHNCSKVSDLVPLEGMKLLSLNIDDSQVMDLTPLRGMSLTTLTLGNCNKVSDLSPLLGMPLTYLDLHDCIGVSDLSPLEGMKLTRLQIGNCKLVTSLLPLKGMPLTTLSFDGCPKVDDLTPLEGMKLESLSFPLTASKGLNVVRKMSSLRVINNYRPAALFWKELDAKKLGK